ncbi:MAG: hypothetical protein IPL19_32990 [Sandaracinaceae bacterium]|nr:hypothetical protein [Sandaracinaceae bacterium]
MNLVIGPYGSSGGAGEVVALVDRERERALSTDGSLQQALLRSMSRGSAGVIAFDSGSGPYLPHVGTSPTVFDSRGMARNSPALAPRVPAEGARPTTRQTVLRMSSAEQALELLAALSLNKSLLAEVLRVSRPTLYDWLGGKEPNAANTQRLILLARLVADAGVTAAHALSPRFMRESLKDGEPSLLELLKADTLDEVHIAKVLAEAKALEAEAGRGRLAREERLRALGFEEPTAEQRKTNLALNVALRDWPKD